MKGRKRLIQSIFLLAVFLFAPVAGLRFVALFWFLLLCINLFYLRYMGRHIQIRRKDPVIRTYKNQSTGIELEVINTGYLPLFNAIISDTTGSLDPTSLCRMRLDMRKRSRRTISYTLRPNERGLWTLGPVKLIIRDLFGWEERSFEQPDRTTVIVYPEVFPLPYQAYDGYPLGTIKTKHILHEDPSRYRALREYQQGDELRRINWKASAHAGMLISNVFESSVDVPLLVLLNLSAPAFPLKSQYMYAERCIEYAASLISSASLVDQSVGCISTGILPEDGQPLHIESGREHRLVILDSLARITLSEETSYHIFTEALKRLPYRSRVCYVGPVLADTLLELLLLTRLKGGDFIVYCIVPKKEELERLHEKSIPVREMETESHG
ncbi:DUF58 domain-containing protein [Gracilinema caldarium]|uniref:DUF58 domain-containing protein n=1 Tax=Gracilinema caldarium (strain ATCC 51460 / DSM 7334 / H1) TaxID=744872 RepID=F8F395_GRAC1|nr:DUF58 domain-containing protein [Gracilinema caldarium]AEJ20421.1 protein of unknown function DUF58 [Gracilinema caldarium DSM 7334]